jgi:hypothetical protein
MSSSSIQLLVSLMALGGPVSQAFQWQPVSEASVPFPPWTTATSFPISQRVAPDGTNWILVRDTVSTAYSFSRVGVPGVIDPVHMNWLEAGFDWDFAPDGTLHVIWASADMFNDGNPFQGLLPEEVALWHRERSPQGVWSAHHKLRFNRIINTGETTTVPYAYQAALATGPQGQLVVASSSEGDDGIQLHTRQNGVWNTSAVDHPNTNDPLSKVLQMQMTRNGALHLFYSGPPAPGSTLVTDVRVARRVLDTWADEVVTSALSSVTFSSLSECGCYPIASVTEFGPSARTIFRPTDLRDADGDGFTEVMEAAFGTSDSNPASRPRIQFQLLPAGASQRPRFGFIGPSSASYLTYASNHVFKETPTLFFPDRGIHIVAEWSDQLDGWSEAAWSANPTFPSVFTGTFPNLIVNKAVWFDALQTVEQSGPRRFFRMVCWRDE